MGEIVNMVVISAEEYRELAEKAKVYDLKRAELLATRYVTDNDRILFEIPKEA